MISSISGLSISIATFIRFGVGKCCSTVFPGDGKEIRLQAGFFVGLLPLVFSDTLNGLDMNMNAAAMTYADDFTWTKFLGLCTFVANLATSMFVGYMADEFGRKRLALCGGAIQLCSIIMVSKYSSPSIEFSNVVIAMTKGVSFAIQQVVYEAWFLHEVTHAGSDSKSHALSAKTFSWLSMGMAIIVPFLLRVVTSEMPSLNYIFNIRILCVCVSLIGVILLCTENRGVKSAEACFAGWTESFTQLFGSKDLAPFSLMHICAEIAVGLMSCLILAAVKTSDPGKLYFSTWSGLMLFQAVGSLLYLLIFSKSFKSTCMATMVSLSGMFVAIVLIHSLMGDESSSGVFFPPLPTTVESRPFQLSAKAFFFCYGLYSPAVATSRAAKITNVNRGSMIGWLHYGRNLGIMLIVITSTAGFHGWIMKFSSGLAFFSFVASCVLWRTV